jgi:hypothetical protein
MKQWDDDAGSAQNDQSFLVKPYIGNSFHSSSVADPAGWGRLNWLDQRLMCGQPEERT